MRCSDSACLLHALTAVHTSCMAPAGLHPAAKLIFTHTNCAQHSSADAVDAYKPVCAQPNDYDADGSVLRTMADSLLRFWSHCYGPDGQGGAVAAVTAAAQQALHQLAVVPLPAAQGGSSLWCEGLFRGREVVSSAFSVASFLRTEQVGWGRRAGRVG